MHRLSLRTALLLLLALAVPVRADVRLPSVISDHMVLQRDMAVPLWGWADPGEEVRVSIAGQTQNTKAGADGKWLVKLAALKEAGPHTLTIQGKNTLTVNDVLVGEVWLASGQSNMAWTVGRSRDFDKERSAANLPQLRMFTVARGPARMPQADCKGSWQVCSPTTVENFSGTAYFFARELHQKLGLPVGVINSSVGGTPIESWMSMDVQQSEPALKGLLASWDKQAAEYDPQKAKAKYEKDLAKYKLTAKEAKDAGKKVPIAPKAPVFPRDNVHHPAVLYNAMIAPLVPYALRGAIWYQGEANGSTEERGKLYGVQLPLLVRDWRTRWGQGEFPFAWAQLPNFQTPGTGWPFVRESMLETLKLPRTGMTINIDIGDPKDIHPTNKQDYGHRLALWARAQVYGEKIPWSGPLPVGHKVQGSTVSLTFRHTEDGLLVKGGELRGFVIAGKDGQWKPAVARIDGERVVVSSPEVPQPVAVRYDWAANPDGNLYNGAGLPASPFRTDRP
jgi:sialate O-acetylesterase